ncbi:hypothetical protein L1049_020529 [Liquidambar formosana]|uniref:PPM-type phosphatase domain-containing protein n=1 Tax=Liquidambar formosana TaxID=63359 RepID=A0AAP0XAT2_LIQFO
MGHFSSMFNGLARSFAIKRGKNSGNCSVREAVEAMAKDAKKNDLILHSSGIVSVDGSNNFASVFSKRGQKGVNQDCFIVWEEAVAQSSLDLDSDKKLHPFNIWKHSFLQTCASIDRELEQHRKIDSFNSGTTSLTIVRQGDIIFVANVGDSRAVLATTSDDGSVVPVQLTIDFKPNLPQEQERIIQNNGRVFCLEDEPGVHRVWLPDEESPGLAMSRAFGDYCVKGFGLISVPEVTQRNITSRDQFVVMATDGVWDVISNQEAVQIVSSTPDRAKSAKRLVECAALAWKHKRRGIAMDDISAICLFFQTPTLSHQVHANCYNGESSNVNEHFFFFFPIYWNVDFV